MKVKKYLSEFIGTMFLVLFACGTAAVLGCQKDVPNIAYLATAIAFGLILIAMAYSIGNVSGCHINPAVSFAMLINGKIKFGDFIGYVIAQCVGAIAGTAILKGLIGDELGFGANSLFQDNVGKTMIIEIILTFVFVITILGVTSRVKNKSISGIVIGFTLTVVHIFGIYFTGTSVNPARSLGPAIFTGGDALSNVWVFIVATLIGGCLAAIVHRIINIEVEEIIIT